MDKQKFSSILIELRKEKGLTQQDFAEIFSVTFQAVSKWETGESLPDIITLEKISSFYNISINDLLNGNKTTVKKEEIIAETVHNEQTSKSIFNIAKIVFNSCALIIFFLLGLIPFINMDFSTPFFDGAYINFNLYQIAFSSNMGYSNFLFLIGFFAFIINCLIGVFSGIFPQNKSLPKLVQALSFYNVIFFITYNMIFVSNAGPGFFILTLYLITYLLLVLFIKPLGRVLPKEEPDIIHWIRSSFVALSFFLTILWIFSDSSSTGRFVMLILMIVSLIATIVFHILNIVKKTKIMNLLFLIFNGITLGTFVIIPIFIESSESIFFTIGAIIIGILYIVYETVCNRLIYSNKSDINIETISN